MKPIVLSRGAIALVDDDDFQSLVTYRWYLSSGYAMRQGGRGDVTKAVLMHRHILGLGRGGEVDHINGDRLDNRRANLRICTHAQNTANRAITKGRRFKGAYRDRNAWRAYITVAGTLTYLGRFGTETEAASAYDAAAIKYFGEFARLNFPTTQSA